MLDRDGQKGSEMWAHSSKTDGPLDAGNRRTRVKKSPICYTVKKIISLVSCGLQRELSKDQTIGC